jgi:crotonobetainyl-CoA:carnitine CoA-transferase CaiB-like acyl-CoA transferase
MLKRDCAIDISTPEGQQICHDLVAETDVVVSNFRPGVLEGFNLGWDDLSRINPSLVMATISGFGVSSDLAAFQALGPTIQAFSGLSAATGYVDGPPSSFFGTYGDVLAGQVGVLAILAALNRRERIGRGVFIDLAMAEAIASIAPEPVLHASLLGVDMERSGNEEPGYAPHGCYPCGGEDCWIAIATFDEKQWSDVAEVLCLDTSDPRFATRADRYRNRTALDIKISAASRAWNKFTLAEALAKRGVAAAPVRTAEDVLADEQLRERGFLQIVDQPELGELVLPALPWQLRMDGVDVDRCTGPAPAFAEGTREILHRVLGMDEARYAQLVACGSIA